MEKRRSLLIMFADYLALCDVPDEAQLLVEAVSDALRVTSAYRPVAPQTVPVACYLPELCEQSAPYAAPLMQQVKADANTFRWRQNPNYQTDPSLAHFRQNYGYIEFVGPQGPMVSDTIRCGLLLMAPHTTYPLHSHETVEFYVTVAGGALWQRGNETDWRGEPAGKIIYHSSWQPHATKTEEKPLLALYGWHGNVKTEAKMLN